MASVLTRIGSVELSSRLDDFDIDQFKLVYGTGTPVGRILFAPKTHIDAGGINGRVKGITGTTKFARVAEGHVELSDGPALGVECDWNATGSRAMGSIHVSE
jgi:hypothetical protein